MRRKRKEAPPIRPRLGSVVYMGGVRGEVTGTLAGRLVVTFDDGRIERITHHDLERFAALRVGLPEARS